MNVNFTDGMLKAVRRFTPKRYVIVHGYYGMGNVGDEAILMATLRAIREVGGEPFVFAWNSDRVRADFGVPSLNPNRAHKFAVWWVLLQARAYLLGGGGLIKDFGGSPRSLSRWLGWLDTARRLGIKTMTWSVGVENLIFPESKALVREVLESLDVVTVRDANSAQRLRDVGVARQIAVTTDPVPFLARQWRSYRQESDGLRIVVCLRHWYNKTNDLEDSEVFGRCLNVLAESLDDLCERHGANVTFVPFRTAPGDDDREVSREVQRRMRTEAVLESAPEPNVEETMIRIAGADLVVGMRLHAVVMATSMGVPALALSYMPKVRDYMTAICQEDNCTDMDELKTEWLLSRAETLIVDGDRFSGDLARHIDNLADAFELNIKILKDLLEGGTSDIQAHPLVEHASYA